MPTPSLEMNMRTLVSLLLAAASFQTAHADPTSAPSAIEAPRRMPGLWLINHGPAGEAAKTRSFHICITKEGLDDVLATPANTAANCREQAWSKDRLYTYYRAQCDTEGGSARIEGRFFGDFQYNFQGELSATPPSGGTAVARTEIDGRRLGPCRNDQAAGKFLIKGQDGVGNLNLAEPIKPSTR